MMRSYRDPRDFESEQRVLAAGWTTQQPAALTLLSSGTTKVPPVEQQGDKSGDKLAAA